MVDAQAYVQAIAKVITASGGVIRSRVRCAEVVYNQATTDADAPTATMLVEFPSREHIDRFLASPEYNALQALRERAWRRLQLVVGQPG